MTHFMTEPEHTCQTVCKPTSLIVYMVYEIKALCGFEKARRREGLKCTCVYHLVFSLDEHKILKLHPTFT